MIKRKNLCLTCICQIDKACHTKWHMGMWPINKLNASILKLQLRCRHNSGLLLASDLTRINQSKVSNWSVKAALIFLFLLNWGTNWILGSWHKNYVWFSQFETCPSRKLLNNTHTHKHARTNTHVERERERENTQQKTAMLPIIHKIEQHICQGIT